MQLKLMAELLPRLAYLLTLARGKPGKVFLAPLLTVSLLSGCGTPAAPLPPSLNLPVPVINLSAARAGDTVRLAWTMPTRTTDKVPLRRPIPVQICRAVDSLPCTDAGSVLVAPGTAGEYTDTLPAELTHGADRELRYQIILRNQAGKSAGPSNTAYSAAGSGPPPLTGLAWQMRREGVQLNWQPAPPTAEPSMIRIQRLRLTGSPPEQASRSPLAPAPPPAAQTLAVHINGTDPGHAIDSSAVFHQRYRYVLERVSIPEVEGRTIEVKGVPSAPLEVTVTDSFPPSVPAGLAAVTDAAAHAIDLSWSPDDESDLAAYSIFRRDAHETLPPQRIATLKLETSFHDTGVETGHTYAYSLTAVDQSGNESQRSPEVEETLLDR